MQLDNLHAFIQTIVELADRHAEALRKSERLTRYALIDPLLRGLGWDTGNPDEVRPEYSAGRGRVDYALMSSGEPVIMMPLVINRESPVVTHSTRLKSSKNAV